MSVTPSDECNTWTPSPHREATPLGLPKLLALRLLGEAGRLLAVSGHHFINGPLPVQLLGCATTSEGGNDSSLPRWVISLRCLRPLGMGRSIFPIVILDTTLPGDQ